MELENNENTQKLSGCEWTKNVDFKENNINSIKHYLSIDSIHLYSFMHFSTNRKCHLLIAIVHN